MKYIVFVTLFLFAWNVQARDFSKVKITTSKLNDTIYMLQGAGGNIAVSAGEDGVFIVDDQFSDLHKKIKRAVRKISKKKISFIINTHWHADHTGGNELFAKAGSTIIAHDNVRKRMSKENYNEVFKRKTPASPPKALPTLTFPNQINLHLNGEHVEVIHYKNAHTDGDAIIFFKGSNIIHTGDLFFNGIYPFIDVDSGGSLKGLIKAIQSILKIADKDTKIIPGHGALATKADLEEYLEMLEYVESRISGLLISHKKDREKILKLMPLAKYDKKLGGGFIKPEVFTKIALRSLSQD